MSVNSSIEWTDGTWNPVRGCTEISPGCARCYARIFSERFRGVPGHPYEQGFDLKLVPKMLGEPLKWKKPRRIFVNSMSDIFHKDVPESFIGQICQTMAAADWHTFQLLTKRADRMASLLTGNLADYAKASHIWWGVSVENQKHGLPRIEALRAVGPAVAFLSVEPLLEDLGDLDLTGIHWVIVGGESGPRARPMEKDWVRRLRDQCLEQKVPFFFKQWGGTRKHLTGRELDGRTWDEFPHGLRQ
jgi:protein gp37